MAPLIFVGRRLGLLQRGDYVRGYSLERPITQKSSPTSTIGGFLNRKWQNLSTAPGDSIRWHRFFGGHLGSLQQGDFVWGYFLLTALRGFHSRVFTHQLSWITTWVNEAGHLGQKTLNNVLGWRRQRRQKYSFVAMCDWLQHQLQRLQADLRSLLTCAQHNPQKARELMPHKIIMVHYKLWNLRIMCL